MKLRVVLAAIVAALILITLAVLWLVYPHQGFRGQVFVEIPKGTGTRRIGSLLADAGVLQSRWQLPLVRLARPRATLKAGEYLFKRPASAWEIFDRLARGDIFYYVLVVPEGNNTFDIAASLDRQGVMPGKSFLEAAHNPAAIRDLDPQAPSLEGYLFPDTYHLTRHNTAQQLCHMMTERFRKAWQQLGAGRPDVHASVTLASLIEKEARLPQERPVIASVYLNRLRIGMPLQCDPTTIYAALLEDRYKGAIHRSDLESRQAYNTYQHPGLPPGPIANPGLDSLRAALHPAQSDFLYFVARADGSGGHQFSKELAQHTRAVQQYRRELEADQAGHAPAVAGRAGPAENHSGRVGAGANPARAR